MPAVTSQLKCGLHDHGGRLPAGVADQPLQGQLVAAAHAGWRGLAGQGGVGILEINF
jgi:hypothetical protein